MPRIRTTMAVCAVALAVLAGCSGGSGKKLAAPTTTIAATVGTGPTTTLRPVDTSFSGQNSAQFCTLAKTYNDRFANVGTATTAAQLRAVAQDGQTAINQAVTAAPAEIKPDVQVLADAFSNLYSELAKVNFDANKVSVDAFTPLQSPQFQASTVRFQAYLKNVCGVSS